MSPSPRSSVDATHSPTSPFLHNLTRRFRTGSSASRASSQSSEATQNTADGSAHAQDAKSTKRYLLSILRDDWEYPTTCAHKDELKPQREALSYRHRDESVSECESSGEQGSRRRSDDPYKFDNPDDVGAVVERRKARKRRLLEQEMTWNEGLRIWTSRRDAWVGAVPHKPAPRSESHKGDTSSRKKRFSRASIEGTSSDSTGRSLDSIPDWPLPNDSDQRVDGSLPADSNTVVGDKDQDAELQDGPYLPIYPPLLPASHALRSRIKPSAYPTIYSKVVVQGLAPNVPIPLYHMVGALVEGWKSEGNWPPQATEPPKAIARKKAKSSESAFRKWKRDQEERKKLAALNGAQEIQCQLEEQPEHNGIRKSISGAVRKALGMAPTEEENAELDLGKMGLTFQTDEEAYSEALEVLKSMRQ